MADVAVIGLGYVGLTTLAGLASLGHSVTGVDLNSDRVAALDSGKVPIFEDGLEQSLAELSGQGLISFTTDYRQISPRAQYFFICVPTPQGASGNADLSYIESAIASVSENAPEGSILIIKSTVPVGTCSALAPSANEKGLEIASNPEFLAEGTALTDFMQPSRIVVGASSVGVANSVMALYEGIEAPRLVCSLTSAETIKHASNSLLSVKLSFVNELAALSEKTGADITEVLFGMSLDPRIGAKFMKPGPGWGGSCFPKDTSELAFTSRQLGSPMLTVEAAIQSNQNSIAGVANAVRKQLGGQLSGKRVAVWGLAFKANTDDTRQSPALAVIDSLLSEGATVVAYDPLATVEERTNLEIAISALEACNGADGLIVLTEWPEFALEDPVAISEVMSSSASVYDARRILNASSWSKSFSNFKTLGQM